MLFISVLLHRMPLWRARTKVRSQLPVPSTAVQVMPTHTAPAWHLRSFIHSCLVFIKTYCTVSTSTIWTICASSMLSLEQTLMHVRSSTASNCIIFCCGHLMMSVILLMFRVRNQSEYLVSASAAAAVEFIVFRLRHAFFCSCVLWRLTMENCCIYIEHVVVTLLSRILYSFPKPWTISVAVKQ